MRPSRILVGEVRAAECLDLLLALNSGLPGMCTLHANSAREALVKMCTLRLLGGENMPRDKLRLESYSTANAALGVAVGHSERTCLSVGADVTGAGQRMRRVLISRAWRWPERC